MTRRVLTSWLEKLGYVAESGGLHLSETVPPNGHPYGPEIRSLLDPDGAIRAKAVFDIEGVPAVVFLADDDAPLRPPDLDEIRKRIWNQNLANVVIEIDGDVARVMPARRLEDSQQTLQLEEVSADGPFSALDVASSNLSRRFPDWFDLDAQVDNQLLRNLSQAVTQLSQSGMSANVPAKGARALAELLMGQVLFISYLEHRQIIGETYRARRKVGKLHALVANHDRDGLSHLIDNLRRDFNGDFLSDDSRDPWALLIDLGYNTLDRFLSRTDMTTGQADFWNYDFSFIPVELLSGLYETFLSTDETSSTGAYYTPRHLATLAIDQSFALSDDPLQEVIFDGACGSGILLTTAYRRLIAINEARSKRRPSFRERKEMLIRRIFGGDISSMACRVTAFSLYLSLLEDLDPADLMEAQAQDRVKLPSLSGRNLVSGQHGDIFDKNHVFAKKRFTLFISNPPWAEPAGGTQTSADLWAAETHAPIPRRQVAGAFTLRALNFLAPNGRLCLILPINQFLGTTSAGFVRFLFDRVRPVRLINFGDLQGLLFPSAEHSCHLFIGTRRNTNEIGKIPFVETFDYCVPKADMSLALGRLTMQSADRHQPQTVSVMDDTQLLVALMWGDSSDLAVWTRLTAYGVLSDFWSGQSEALRWVNRKGVHFHDSAREPMPADKLRAMPFVPVAALSAGSPILHPDLLKQWPADQSTVARLDDALMQVFNRPRVLFPDGFSREEHSLRAVYYDQPASFKHSIGVIAGPQEDALLLKFLAIYLRSSLARYFLMLRAWKMLSERNAVHLSDIKGFPFFRPEFAPDPDDAKSVLDRTANRLAALAELPELEQSVAYGASQQEFDNDVFDYFSVASEERAIILETVDVLMPAIRPRGYKNLNTSLQQGVGPGDLKRYARRLTGQLTEWRKRTGGKGRFSVNVVSSEPRRAGAVGVVRIGYSSDRSARGSASLEISDLLVQQTLVELRQLGLSLIPTGDTLHLVPDTFIWTDEALYLARPLIKRHWTMRQAVRDAARTVRDVQQGSAAHPFPEVA